MDACACMNSSRTNDAGWLALKMSENDEETLDNQIIPVVNVVLIGKHRLSAAAERFYRRKPQQHVTLWETAGGIWF